MPGPPITLDGASGKITIKFPRGEVKPSTDAGFDTIEVTPTDSFASIKIEGPIPIGPIPLTGKNWKLIIE